ncbi:hypothetical protein SAMN02927923_04079 [Microvirga guangxiensis]|uniref:Uncharacterized protein n=1 Tax=Microvirga guangxiensis TaxID=549386 RepID=A0A1G5L9F4_9HYPH|nr:hypothetical protein SAMN02927923_04079 [Microvirga guangxiensis]
MAGTLKTEFRLAFPAEGPEEAVQSRDGSQDGRFQLAFPV